MKRCMVVGAEPSDDKCLHVSGVLKDYEDRYIRWFSEISLLTHNNQHR